MLKVVKNEGTVDIGKTKEDILESRRENLKCKNLHSMFFKIMSLGMSRRGIGCKKEI